MIDTRAFANVLLEIHLNLQSLETRHKMFHNQQNITNTYKKKIKSGTYSRFCAFHWITVFFVVKSSLWFYPNFALSVITYHITCYIRMRSERHFPYEKIVLNDGFPSNTVVGVLLRKSMTFKHFLFSYCIFIWCVLFYHFIVF